jgi:hypothetical protein
MAYLRALLRDTRALATAAVAAGSLIPVVLSREKRQAFSHCQVMCLGCQCLVGSRRHGKAAHACARAACGCGVVNVSRPPCPRARQVPCGIFDDKMRFTALFEDVRTIQKAQVRPGDVLREA